MTFVTCSPALVNCLGAAREELQPQDSAPSRAKCAHSRDSGRSLRK